MPDYQDNIYEFINKLILNHIKINRSDIDIDFHERDFRNIPRYLDDKHKVKFITVGEKFINQFKINHFHNMYTVHCSDINDRIYVDYGKFQTFYKLDTSIKLWECSLEFNCLSDVINAYLDNKEDYDDTELFKSFMFSLFIILNRNEYSMTKRYIQLYLEYLRDHAEVIYEKCAPSLRDLF